MVYSINNNQQNFFQTLLSYSEDGNLSETELSNLKKIYTDQTGPANHQFEDFIAPTLQEYISIQNRTNQIRSIKDIMKQAIADEELTSQEYQEIRNYFIYGYNLPALEFDKVMAVVLGDEVSFTNWINSKKQQALNIRPKMAELKKVIGDNEDALVDSFIDLIEKNLINGRLQDDFSQYVFDKLKKEINLTGQEEDKNLYLIIKDTIK